MRIVFELDEQHTEAEGDDAARDVFDYLLKVSGLTVTNYWIED